MRRLEHQFVIVASTRLHFAYAAGEPLSEATHYLAICCEQQDPSPQLTIGTGLFLGDRADGGVEGPRGLGAFEDGRGLGRFVNGTAIAPGVVYDEDGEDAYYTDFDNAYGGYAVFADVEPSDTAQLATFDSTAQLEVFKVDTQAGEMAPLGSVRQRRKRLAVYALCGVVGGTAAVSSSGAAADSAAHRPTRRA